MVIVPSNQIDLNALTGVMDREEAYRRLDVIEAQMAEVEGIECPLIHVNTPPLYSRKVLMPAGALVSSQTHKTTHQYVIPIGRLMVWEYETGWQLVEAPDHRITTAGTRRLLLILEPTVWITFHAVEGDTIEELEDNLFEKRINPLITSNEPSLAIS